MVALMAKGAPIKIGKYRFGVECGQRWWLFRSWFPRKKHPNLFRRIPGARGGWVYIHVWRRRFAGLRRFDGGAAFGPLMVWWEE